MSARAADLRVFVLFFVFFCRVFIRGCKQTRAQTDTFHPRSPASALCVNVCRSASVFVVRACLQLPICSASPRGAKGRCDLVARVKGQESPVSICGGRKGCQGGISARVNDPGDRSAGGSLHDSTHDTRRRAILSAGGSGPNEVAGGV